MQAAYYLPAGDALLLSLDMVEAGFLARHNHGVMDWATGGWRLRREGQPEEAT